MRYLIILLLFSTPAFAQDYSVGSTVGGILTNSTIDKACTGRCLARGGNQSFCDDICDEAVKKYLPEQAAKEINDAVKDDFSEVNFPCFKRCRESSEVFETCKVICKQ